MQRIPFLQFTQMLLSVTLAYFWSAAQALRGLPGGVAPGLARWLLPLPPGAAPLSSAARWRLCAPLPGAPSACPPAGVRAGPCVCRLSLGLSSS